MKTVPDLFCMERVRRIVRVMEKMPSVERARGKSKPAKTAAVAAPPLSPAVPDGPLYRLSVAQYHKMIEADIIDEDAPVELLEGLLVQKMGKNPPHNLATGQLQDLLPP